MGETNAFELRCGDEPLLTFLFREDALGTVSAHILGIDEGNSHLMPWGFGVGDDGLYGWLERRALPHNRANAARIARALGFAPGDLKAAYSVTMGLSLNDSYWTPAAGSASSFADVNLYENPFSEALFSVAFAGVGEGWPGLTPEFTTDGTLRKAWRIGEGDVRELCKGASNGWFPGEPASEVLASFLAAEAGIDAVRYSLETDGEGGFVSVCPCFCTRDASYTPFASATGMTDMTGVIAFAASHGRDELERVCDMIAFDSLIANSDRHFANFGLMRDSETGDFLRFAPIFDNGRGLLPMLGDDRLDDASFELAILTSAFGGLEFAEQARRVVGSRQLEWCEALAGGGVERAMERAADAYPALSPRAGAMARIIEERAVGLARVTAVDHDALAARALDAIRCRTETNDHTVRPPFGDVASRDVGESEKEPDAKAMMKTPSAPYLPREPHRRHGR